MQKALLNRAALVVTAIIFTAPCYAQSAPAGDPDEARIQDIITASHILTNEGILDSFGHISARSDEESRSLLHPARHAAGARFPRRHRRGRA